MMPEFRPVMSSGCEDRAGQVSAIAQIEILRFVISDRLIKLKDIGSRMRFLFCYSEIDM
jgi:hypothetical protein